VKFIYLGLSIFFRFSIHYFLICFSSLLVSTFTSSFLILFGYYLDSDFSYEFSNATLVFFIHVLYAPIVFQSLLVFQSTSIPFVGSCDND
jgi:hypothetical protein